MFEHNPRHNPNVGSEHSSCTSIQTPSHQLKKYTFKEKEKRNLLGSQTLKKRPHNRKSNRKCKSRPQRRRPRAKEEDPANMATDALAAPVEGLPSVLLLQILGFLDHGALHAAERTASVFCGLVRSESTSVGLHEGATGALWGLTRACSACL
jgi:hypothetical protein